MAQFDGSAFYLNPTTSYNKLLIKICAVDGCDHWWRDHSIYEAILTGLPRETTPVLLDGRGQRVPAKILDRDDAKVLQFRALAGEQYLLELEGELAPFKLQLVKTDATATAG